MRSEILLAATLSIALAGCTATTGTAKGNAGASAERTDPLSLKATGEARRCITNTGNTHTTPAGPNVLMFRQGVNNWFRNDLRGSCPALHSSRTLVFRNTTGQRCDMDMFEVVDTVSGMNFGSCSLGMFTPVEVPRGTRF